MMKDNGINENSPIFSTFLKFKCIVKIVNNILETI